jgi:phosphoribosylformimino-5-aminoimidazole carboxamide ribotide isomerase
MVGADADTFGALVLSTQHPLIAAGGIARVEDLRELAERGVAGAVLGMSIYTGAIDPRAAAREFAI